MTWPWREKSSVNKQSVSAWRRNKMTGKEERHVGRVESNELRAACLICYCLYSSFFLHFSTSFPISIHNPPHNLIYMSVFYYLLCTSPLFTWRRKRLSASCSCSRLGLVRYFAKYVSYASLASVAMGPSPSVGEMVVTCWSSLYVEKTSITAEVNLKITTSERYKAQWRCGKGKKYQKVSEENIQWNFGQTHSSYAYFRPMWNFLNFAHCKSLILCRLSRW